MQKTKRALRYLAMMFYHRFVVIPTCEEAENRGLVLRRNVYGDEINRWNCRSFWADEFGYEYRCAQIKKDKALTKEEVQALMKRARDYHSKGGKYLETGEFKL